MSTTPLPLLAEIEAQLAGLQKMATLVVVEEKRKKEAAEKEEAERKKKEQEEKEQERKETEWKQKANAAKNRRKEPIVQPAGIRANPTTSPSKRKTDEVSDMTDSELSRKKKKNGDLGVDEGKLRDRCDECRRKSEECRWPMDGRRKTCLGCSRRKTVCVVDGICFGTRETIGVRKVHIITKEF